MDQFVKYMQARDIQDAVFRTVCFFDIFDFCLTGEEISDRLMGFTADFEAVQAALRDCPAVDFRDGFYYLKGRDSLVLKRQQGQAYHEQLWNKVLRYRWVFRMIPFLRHVYVCNTLAMSQAAPGSDIDFFIVTKPGRMFIARTCLLFFTHVLRLRRQGSHIAGRFCLSFFADEDHTDFSGLFLTPYDPYFSYWLKLLRPIDVSPGFFAKAWEWLLSGSFGNFVESRLARWQLERAQKKYRAMGSPYGVVLERYCLKFHDKDMREYYRAEWEKRLTSA